MLTHFCYTARMLAIGSDGQAPTQTLPVVYTRKAVGELTLPERTAWSRLRGQNPALYSPYFDIAYTDQVSALRPDTFVIIASRGGQAAAFLPCQGTGRLGFAAPIGSPMTDYHGLIKAPDDPIDLKTMLEEAGVGGFGFNALIETNCKPLTVRKEHEAAVMDLANGAQAWRAEKDGSYRRSLKSLRRRIRNTETEYGERRFDFKSADPAVFATLIKWKQAQFKLTGKYDVLAAGWTLSLLERLFAAPDNALRCDMHVLYFGDKIAAVDLGLSDGATYHSWIVAYDSEFAALSPGIQLLEALMDEAPALGYSRIDLGAGTGGYKKHYASVPLIVKSGFAAVQGPAGKILSVYAKAEEAGETSMKDIPGKVRRRFTQIANCDPSFMGRAKAMASAIKVSK